MPSEAPARPVDRIGSLFWPTTPDSPSGSQNASHAVDIVHVRDHEFVKRGEGGRKHPGCAVCGAGKTRMVHVGVPASLNAGNAGSNYHAYQTVKRRWEERLRELLEASGLPKGLDHVLVEGQMCFPSRIRRDQGNYRFMVEKALGDALVAGGWLEDDDWSRYEFGRLRYDYERGKAWTALTLFPQVSSG